MSFEVEYRSIVRGGECPDFPRWLEMRKVRGYADRHLSQEDGYWVARIIKKLTIDARAKVNRDDWVEVSAP